MGGEHQDGPYARRAIESKAKREGQKEQEARFKLRPLECSGVPETLPKLLTWIVAGFSRPGECKVFAHQDCPVIFVGHLSSVRGLDGATCTKITKPRRGSESATVLRAKIA